jgi:hypothetical protein
VSIQPDPREIAAIVRTVLQVERKWQGLVPAAGDGRHTPWMPFQPFAFIALAAEALPEVDFPAVMRARFLEIGAGPGTKMLLMREIFGFSVRGFERTDEYAAAARSMGLDVQTCDALDWKDYSAELVWFNRVFRDPAPQRELEQRVWDETDPGAVVMCANLESRPPRSWFPVLDAWDEERRGIWQKYQVNLGGEDVHRVP